MRERETVIMCLCFNSIRFSTENKLCMCVRDRLWMCQCCFFFCWRGRFSLFLLLFMYLWVDVCMDVFIMFSLIFCFLSVLSSFLLSHLFVVVVLFECALSVVNIYWERNEKSKQWRCHCNCCPSLLRLRCSVCGAVRSVPSVALGLHEFCIQNVCSTPKCKTDALKSWKIFKRNV